MRLAHSPLVFFFFIFHLSSSPTLQVHAWTPSATVAKRTAVAPPRLYYRNRLADDDRFTTAGATTAAAALPRTTTATPPPLPMADAEPIRLLNRVFLLQGRKQQQHQQQQQEVVYKKQEPACAINQPMMKKLVLSQVTLLSLTTAIALIATAVSATGFVQSLNWIPASAGLPFFASSGEATALSRLLVGVVAAVPMILVSTLIDHASSRRDTSQVHFATTNMVVSLFGRRRRTQRQQQQQQQQQQPMLDATEEQEGGEEEPPTTTTWQVVLSSMGLSALTSITEETVFRGYIPALILALTHSSVVAWIGQAVLFGLGHVHPAAQQGENRIVATTQALNALLGYGLVYWMTSVTGGNNVVVDLWPCIVAHALYDMHVLVSSWHNVNGQMDWTEESMMRNPAQSETDRQTLQQLQDWAGTPALTTDTLNTCRRFFYAFDEDRQHALSLPNVQRAMSYAFLTDDQQPTTAQVERLFHKVLQERPPEEDAHQEPKQQQRQRQEQQQEEANRRINLSEFVRLLFSLRAHTLKLGATQQPQVQQ